MKFNIEVGRLRHWINSHRDIQEQFDVSAVEAFKLWNNPSLMMIAQNDIKLLGFDENGPEQKCA
jgi:hypothetical protein